MDSRLLLAAILVTGILVPGVANYYLASAGYHTLATITWVGGYGLMVFVVWYGWIRPLDLRGPGDGTER